MTRSFRAKDTDASHAGRKNPCTLASGIIVMAVNIPKLSKEEAKDSGRPIGQIMMQPVFIVATLCATVGQAVMIGDSLTSDIAGGVGAGIDTIWFNRHGASATAIAPTHEVTSIHDIGPILGLT